MKVFHVSVFLYYQLVNYNIALGIIHAHERLGRPKDDQLVNRMIDGAPTYFTGWNLTMQQMYFAICCFEHVMELFPKFLSSKIQDDFKRFRKMMLSVFLLPCSCAVVCIFWSFYAISPDLMFGDLLDTINPGWVNHAIHTFVAPLTVVELFARASTDGGIWNKGFARGATYVGSFFFVYLVFICFALLHRGMWPYPLLDGLHISHVAGFLVLSYAVIFFFLYAGLRFGNWLQGGSSGHLRSMKTKKA